MRFCLSAYAEIQAARFETVSQSYKKAVIPAQAGIQLLISLAKNAFRMPAFTGMTNCDTVSSREVVNSRRGVGQRSFSGLKSVSRS